MTSQPPPPDGPPARRERNAVETRRRLLDAAETEFALKGFAGVRLREVAQAAGVQQALIHHYFTDKEGLYRAVLDRAIEQTTADSWVLLEQATSLVGLLDSFVGMLLRFYTAHANLLAMLRMEAASGSHLVLDVIQARSRPVFEAAEKVLEAYQRQGQLRADIAPADAIVAVLSATLFPLLEAPLLEALWPALTPGTGAIEQRQKVIVGLLLDGLTPRGS